MNETSFTQPTPAEHKNENLLSELIKFALITLIIVLPIRIYIAQPFIVSGSSMDPTFANGQYLIIDEISYRFNDPQRGDVIIFRYPNDTTKFFIKRVIGLPGETIDIDGTTVTITNEEHPDGFVLDESHIERPTWSTTHMKLDIDEYFVMGDNRPASSDSRVWGTLDRDLIIGRAFVRLLPVSELGVFPGQHTYNASTLAQSDE